MVDVYKRQVERRGQQCDRRREEESLAEQRQLPLFRQLLRREQQCQSRQRQHAANDVQIDRAVAREAEGALCKRQRVRLDGRFDLGEDRASGFGKCRGGVRGGLRAGGVVLRPGQVARRAGEIAQIRGLGRGGGGNFGERRVRIERPRGVLRGGQRGRGVLDGALCALDLAQRAGQRLEQASVVGFTARSGTQK